MRTPYLIQRMIRHRDVPKNPSLDELYLMDYMGSSEFEWGALPKSLKQFTKNFDKLELLRMKKLADYENKMLVLIGLPENTKEYKQYIPDLLEDRIHLKEWINLKSAIKGMIYSNRQYDETRHPSAWWDIQNNIMIVFSIKRAKNLLKAIGVVRDKKIENKETEWY
jgi:hypothetical protein